MVITPSVKAMAFLQPFALPCRRGPALLNRFLSSAGEYQRQYSVTPVASATPRRMPAIIRPVVPAPPLLQFLEDGVYQRSNVVKALGEYVREHNLQDPSNKSIVKCDEKLRNLFGVDQCTMQEISKYISPHLLKPETVGGKYLAEARQIEDEYLREKDRAPASSSGKKKKTRRSVKEDNTSSNHLLRPVILSEELAIICRRKEMPRPQIVKAIWDYIRLNNLKGKPGEPVRCDFLLRKVYKADKIDVKDVMRGIEAHVTRKE